MLEPHTCGLRMDADQDKYDENNNEKFFERAGMNEYIKIVTI